MNNDVKKEKLKEALKQDKNYKFSLFYFNPKDNRIIVPKRYGIGYTLNFGQPIAVIFIILAIGWGIYNLFS